MSRHLKIPVADTVLDANDTGGDVTPVLLLNGMYATQRHWKAVLPKLSGRYRVVTFDGRARGKSGTSSDYSFAGCLEDVSAVLDATGLQRPILAGWSHGAAVAVRYAAQHPDKIAGVVCIDGALPVDPIDDAFRDRVRKLFRRNAIPIKILGALGLGTRMSAAQAAEANIELNELSADIATDYAHTQCPVTVIKATGKHLGTTEEEMRKVRANIDPIVASNPNVTIFATVPSNHSRIVAKHPDTIAAAIDAVASQAFHPNSSPRGWRSRNSQPRDLKEQTMPITLTDHDELTLATAAHGAVTLIASASAKQAGRVASAGAIALSSATGQVGHVLAKRPRGTDLAGKSTAELADQVLPALTATMSLLKQQDPAEADNFRRTVALATEAASVARRGKPSPVVAEMSRKISVALDAA